MAILPVNSLLNGMTGTLGDLVFRKKNGRTYVSKRPKRRKKSATAVPTKNEEQFRRCVNYAKEVIKDPAVKRLYAAAAPKGQSAYNVAFADAFKAPEIKCIHTELYKGRKKDCILVKATDDFKVANVLVSVYSAKGKLIEQGNAVAKNHSHWTYVITRSNKKYLGCSVTATATDLPGNETSLTVQVPSPEN